MLTVVCWKWKPNPGYRSTFGPEMVNVLRHMVRRHYRPAHRFVCVTDDATGLDPEVEVVPLWDEFADIPNPHGIKNPSCYRRLKAFAPEAREMFGDRFVSVDLDTVIVGDLAPLWDRPEDFIIWEEQDPRSYYNGSMFLMTAGARKQVYETFDPATTPQAAFRAGRFGSDQGVVSFVLGKGEATWGCQDGVYSYRRHIRQLGGSLPENARIVMFHGPVDPDSPEARRLRWCKEAYC